MMDIQKIISGIDTLVPISNISEKVAAVIADPQSSLQDVVDIVSYDQHLTVNLLRICNSSYMGLRRKIGSVREAVTYLGVDKVVRLAMLGNSASNFIQSQRGYDLEAGQLWHYSVSAAVIGEHLAKICQYPESALIFTAALLKDIGKIILSDYVAPAYQAILEEVAAHRIPFDEAEKRVIGIDHAELGAMAAEKWNFSPVMVDIIRWHHSPKQAELDRRAVAIVHLADCVCMMIGNGVGADGLAYKCDTEAISELGLNAADLQAAIAFYWEKMKEIKELVSLSGGID
jgi:putative nucleotidyltransferase with HDIG domain